MTALYNEIDPYAADWLEALIARGLIAPGVVDRRSVEDLTPDYVSRFNQVHLFAGIGVWSYSARLAGLDDTRSFWTMSCPCQPFSAAGKGGGFTDERHLWPAAFHLIEQCRPGRIYGEQVADRGGLAWLDLVSTDLEGTNYAFGAVDTCSAGFGAPHRRQRLRFVAVDNAQHEGLERLAGDVHSGYQPRRLGTLEAGYVASASAFGGVADDGRGRREMADIDSRGSATSGGVGQASEPGMRGASDRLADTSGQGWPVTDPSQRRNDPDGLDLFGGLADSAKPGWLTRWRIGEQGGMNLR